MAVKTKLHNHAAYAVSRSLAQFKLSDSTVQVAAAKLDIDGIVYWMGTD